MKCSFHKNQKDQHTMALWQSLNFGTASFGSNRYFSTFAKIFSFRFAIYRQGVLKR